MIVTHMDGAHFKVQHGNLIVAVNPPQKDSKRWTASKYGSSVVLTSLNDPDMSGIDQVTYGANVPFAITCPGEYEFNDIFFRGLVSKSRYGLKEGERTNTIYSFSIDGIQLCFLGAMSEKQLPPETLEALEEIDLLFVPVDKQGVHGLAPKDAHTLAVSLEPHLIVPYALGEESDLELFLKEAGVKNPQKTDKIALKKKDLTEKQAEIMLLEKTS